MAIGYIYNGFGIDMTLYYAGTPFYLPKDAVTPIPDWNFREVDHAASTTDAGVELTYKNIYVPGLRIAEELVDKQIPHSYASMGIMRIEGRRLGTMRTVHAGTNAETTADDLRDCPIDGLPCASIHVEVAEKAVTGPERQIAESRAKTYKETIIKDYLQSKRQRMSGGVGALHPDSTTRSYMEELGIEDLDDITAHAKDKNLNADLIRSIVEAVIAGQTTSNAKAIVDAISEARKGNTGNTYMRKLKHSVIDHDKVRAELKSEKKARRQEMEEVAEDT